MRNEVLINRHIYMLNSPHNRVVNFTPPTVIDNLEFIFDFSELIDGDNITLGKNVTLKVNGTNGELYTSPVSIDSLIKPHHPEISIGPMNWYAKSFEIEISEAANKSIVISVHTID